MTATFIEIEHAETHRRAKVARSSFDRFWQYDGWTEVEQPRAVTTGEAGDHPVLENLDPADPGLKASPVLGAKPDGTSAGDLGQTPQIKGS